VAPAGGVKCDASEALLAQLESTTSFNAGAMWGTTNIAQRIPTEHVTNVVEVR